VFLPQATRSRPKLARFEIQEGTSTRNDRGGEEEEEEEEEEGRATSPAIGISILGTTIIGTTSRYTVSRYTRGWRGDRRRRIVLRSCP
jgi:hypothetical protein